MKKYLAMSSLVLLLALPVTAEAAASTPTVIESIAGGGAGPEFLPFATAVGVAEFVIYANAEGIPFPLCGVNGWQCFDEYPEAVHKDGV